MNAQDLKNSILQLAIQGNLVEQREEKGTAKELLEKIEAEKKQLIKESKIKKQKALPEIKEDEIPFDIPESWEWVRLGDITHNWGQKKPDTTFDYIDVGSIDNVRGRLSDDENLVQAKNAPSRARKIVKKGSVIYSTVRPYLLNICIIDKEFKCEPIASTAFAILHPFSGLNENYLYHVLRSTMFISYVNSMMLGVAYPAINDANLLSGVIPLPPLEEQKRIVAKIEELMPYVDKYDVAYSEVEKLNKKFPEDMQKSILQYAIQGKLVEQQEEDGKAEDLYKQIQEEKKKLIKEGKIKKTKALPEITEDEIPFDIPENWKWVRLGELLYKLTDGTHSTPKYTSTGVPFISVKDISSGEMDFSNTKFISQEEHESLYKRCNPEQDDILLTKVGTTGIPVIVDTDKEFSLFVSVALLKFNTELIYNKYLMHVIKAPVVQIQARENTRGVGNKNWVMRDIANTILPLPPLAEQKRIVQKIEDLLPYTKQLVKKVD